VHSGTYLIADAIVVDHEREWHADVCRSYDLIAVAVERPADEAAR
jgi:hypothetical protein